MVVVVAVMVAIDEHYLGVEYVGFSKTGRPETKASMSLSKSSSDSRNDAMLTEVVVTA